RTFYQDYISDLLVFFVLERSYQDYIGDLPVFFVLERSIKKIKVATPALFLLELQKYEHPMSMNPFRHKVDRTKAEPARSTSLKLKPLTRHEIPCHHSKIA